MIFKWLWEKIKYGFTPHHELFDNDDQDVIVVNSIPFVVKKEQEEKNTE